jgi:hypothetical protein
MIPLGPLFSALDTLPRKNTLYLPDPPPSPYSSITSGGLGTYVYGAAYLALRARGTSSGSGTVSSWTPTTETPFFFTAVDTTTLSFGWDPSVPLLYPSTGSCQECVATPSMLQTTVIPDDPETIRLRDELLRASPAQRELLLDKLRDGSSASCTSALAAAIPRLSGETQNKVRETLVERLRRLSSVALRMKLGDANVELRRAALLACAVKQDTNQVPDLIARLEVESDAQVMQTLGVALKTLTTRELYLSTDTDRETRIQVARNWREWWNNEGVKHASR